MGKDAKQETKEEYEELNTSFDEKSPLSKNCFNEALILIGKIVDFSSFTFDAPSFQIEEYFLRMSGISIATQQEKVPKPHQRFLQEYELYFEYGYCVFS